MIMVRVAARWRRIEFHTGLKSSLRCGETGLGPFANRVSLATDDG